MYCNHFLFASIFCIIWPIKTYLEYTPFLAEIRHVPIFYWIHAYSAHIVQISETIHTVYGCKKQECNCLYFIFKTQSHGYECATLFKIQMAKPFFIQSHVVYKLHARIRQLTLKMFGC